VFTLRMPNDVNPWSHIELMLSSVRCCLDEVGVLSHCPWLLQVGECGLASWKVTLYDEDRFSQNDGVQIRLSSLFSTVALSLSSCFDFSLFVQGRFADDVGANHPRLVWVSRDGAQILRSRSYLPQHLILAGLQRADNVLQQDFFFSWYRCAV
jgi:hypothetical protein